MGLNLSRVLRNSADDRTQVSHPPENPGRFTPSHVVGPGSPLPFRSALTTVKAIPLKEVWVTKDRRLLAIALAVLALGVVAHAEDTADISGILLWNGEPFHECCQEVPTVEVRASHGYGAEIEGYEYSYDPDTSRFEIRGLRLVDKSEVAFQTTGELESLIGAGVFRGGFPINFSYFDPEKEKPVDMAYGFSLLEPVELIASMAESHISRIPVQTPVALKWAEVPEATHYWIQINRHDDEGGVPRILDTHLAVNWIEIDLPEREGSWYSVDVYAYNDRTRLGQLWTTGLGWETTGVCLVVTAVAEE